MEDNPNDDSSQIINLEHSTKFPDASPNKEHESSLTVIHLTTTTTEDYNNKPRKAT